MAKKKIEIEKPIWLKRSKEEVESIILKLAEKGIGMEKIGLILRDTYGIPSTKIIAGKISKILAGRNIRHEPSDISNLRKKLEKIKSHLEKNRQDKVAKRGMQITSAKIIRLDKYYKGKKD